MKKRGFTLAEVLITLAIIGVVAAIAIPSVISNSQQQEFKTGLRKAVSVLNSAITMNMAIDGESPYDNADLYNYLKRHMSIVRTTDRLPWISTNSAGSELTQMNHAFYTTDGMRFEFKIAHQSYACPPLHETGPYNKTETGEWVRACTPSRDTAGQNCGGCGSYGLRSNPNGTTKPPCVILVDVNGDKKPTPSAIACTYGNYTEDCLKKNIYKIPTAESKKVNDIFLILITENKAMPYGVTAQKAMYDAQK